MQPTKLNLDFKVRSVAAGDRHIVIVAEDGTVYTSGSNYNKQLGINSNAKFSTLQKLNVNNVVKAEAGLHHTLLLTDDGKV